MQDEQARDIDEAEAPREAPLPHAADSGQPDPRLPAIPNAARSLVPVVVPGPEIADHADPGTWLALIHRHLSRATADDNLLRRYRALLVMFAVLLPIIGVTVAIVLANLPWWLAGGTTVAAAGGGATVAARAILRGRQERSKAAGGGRRKGHEKQP